MSSPNCPPRRGSLRPGAMALTSLLIVTLAGGCWTPPKATMRQEKHGLVWILPGVLANSTSMYGAYRGFRDAGVDTEIRISEWDRPLLDLLGQLQNCEANRALAGRIADETVTYARAHPGAPINLVGYSAGGGIALMVAEALPDNVRLHNVILVQPGISPTWDLTRVLRVVDGHVVNFYSELDWVILGLGTKTFGTVDRKNVESAGKTGFDLERAVPDAAERGKVIQVAWKPAMIWMGHPGDHLAILLYGWNRKYVAPYLLDTTVDDQGAVKAATSSAPSRNTNSE